MAGVSILGMPIPEAGLMSEHQAPDAIGPVVPRMTRMPASASGRPLPTVLDPVPP